MSKLCTHCVSNIDGVLRGCCVEGHPQANVNTTSYTVTECAGRARDEDCRICASLCKAHQQDGIDPEEIQFFYASDATALGRRPLPGRLRINRSTWDRQVPSLMFSLVAVGPALEDDDQIWVEQSALDNPSAASLDCDSGSDISLSLARSWVEQCHEGHGQKSSKGSQNWSPSRLIDVGDVTQKTIRLLDRSQSGTCTSYTTLSHCWGQTHVLRLTKATESSLRVGVATSSLPKTFRDAVNATKALNVKYLWIDALCIFQDSIADWKVEAELMAKVYQHSYCNLSASDAPNDDGGLFFRYEKIYLKPLVFNHWRYVYDMPARVPVALITGTRAWSDHLQDRILYTRAWVLQERMLAPCNLHFTKDGILFECACGHALTQLSCFVHGHLYYSNGFTFQDDGIKSTGLSRARQLLAHSSSSISPKSLHYSASLYQRPSEMTFIDTWNELAQAYSSLELTFPKDKHIAFAGIAKVLSEKIDEPCYAGLWKRSLPCSLLWHPNYASKRSLVQTASLSQQQAMTKDSTTPSWSWASCEQAIILFEAPDRVTPYLGRQAFEKQYEQKGRNIQTLSNVLAFYAAQTLPVFPFYTDARLHLRGYMRTFTLDARSAYTDLAIWPTWVFPVPRPEFSKGVKSQIEPRTGLRSALKKTALQISGSRQEQVEITLQYDDVAQARILINQGVPIVCLLVAIEEKRGFGFLHGLILKCESSIARGVHAGVSVYRRMGCIKWHPFKMHVDIYDVVATFEQRDIILI